VALGEPLGLRVVVCDVVRACVGVAVGEIDEVRVGACEGVADVVPVIVGVRLYEGVSDAVTVGEDERVAAEEAVEVALEVAD